MFNMKHADSESPSDIARWLQSESADLWPAVLGYVLYGRANGRRVAVYVPEELVPQVQRGLDNGRALQDLLHQAAPRYIKALKRERAEAKKTDEG